MTFVDPMLISSHQEKESLQIKFKSPLLESEDGSILAFEETDDPKSITKQIDAGKDEDSC